MDEADTLEKRQKHQIELYEDRIRRAIQELRRKGTLFLNGMQYDVHGPEAQKVVDILEGR